METPKNEPWNFCETPEEKCTMNYCDDNGCQNRKRVLASEMEALKEGTWYIRGCGKLKEYFDKIECIRSGDIYEFGYYIEDGKWNYYLIEHLQHRKEITLQDYLDSLKPQSLDELDLEIKEKERSAIKFLKSRGYSVTKKPKLTIAELCEKAGLDINNIEIIK